MFPEASDFTLSCYSAWSHPSPNGLELKFGLFGRLVPSSSVSLLAMDSELQSQLFIILHKHIRTRSVTL